MTLAERVKKSEVFAKLPEADIEVVSVALEAGNEEVTEEVTSILDQEEAINDLFDKGIEELTEHTVGVITKRVENMEKQRRAAKEEASDRAYENEEAEHDLELLETNVK